MRSKEDIRDLIDDSGGYKGLARAIILQAYIDLIKAHTDIIKGEITGKSERRKILKFFKSEWGNTLGCDEMRVSQIDKICKFRAEYNLWRIDYGCSRCKYSCIHRGDSWYHVTDMNISNLKCGKDGKKWVK